MAAVIFGLTEDYFDGRIVAYPCRENEACDRFCALKVCVVPWEERKVIRFGKAENLFDEVSYKPLIRSLFITFYTAQLVVILEPDTLDVFSYIWRKDLVWFKSRIRFKRRVVCRD